MTKPETEKLPWLPTAAMRVPSGDDAGSLLYTADQMRAFYQQGREDEREAIRAQGGGAASWTHPNPPPPDSREGRMVTLERDDTGKPTVWCDPEIATLVYALNSAGIATVASCSGHGEAFGNIALKDGRELWILPDYETARRVERLPGLYTTPVPAPDAGWTEEHAERLAKFIYQQEAAKCSTLEAYQQHMKHWPRALPEARAMLAAAHARSAGGEGRE